MDNKIEHNFEINLEIQEPKKYKVLLLNDDISTMEFVIDILKNIFRKSLNESETIMLDVHNKGKAVCGIYTHEIASTKIAQVKYNAQKAGYPLKAILEEE
ncbi:ATP-dependent Clp protease adaptor protein ClpS [hydrothermal vent metagenome]|uniref:ATP-dependent Clp protease adaptor protein ClpS n=1 Tax=hydrothermal vent metagenome TaxID=652676 RepID=A0A3B1E2L9_9ZZZZ